MAVVPVTIYGMLYPAAKGEKPQMVTLTGVQWNPTLDVGGGPILPPDEVKPPEPPLTIWPNPPEGIAPLPEHPIVIPPPVDLPPIDPPASSTQPVKPNAWNWNDGKDPQYPNAGWYYVYVPDPNKGQPGPKRK